MFAQRNNRTRWQRRLLSLSGEEAFQQAALELFSWQFTHCPPYARLAASQGILPKNITHWSEIPAVPQALFKEIDLRSHSATRTRHTFLTSGTTGAMRGRHHLAEVDIYRAVSTRGAQEAGFFQPKMTLHFLTPSAHSAPESSLSRMFQFWKKSGDSTGSAFWVQRGRLRLTALRAALEQAGRDNQPIALLGPAFSFVHLLDAWIDRPLCLPPGSFLLETGGFKGRTREIEKKLFYAQLSTLFHVPDENIWNEYGMTELSSQAYARGATGEHHAPRWARVLIVHPETGQSVRVGQRGLVRWIDLANVDSVLAVQTQDLAQRTRSGFRLIGRRPGLSLRGCSLTAEELTAT